MDSYESLLEIKRITPDWDSMKLIKFEKNLYVEHEDVRARAPAAANTWREDNELWVEGDAPKPVLTFQESQLPKYVLDVCAKHYDYPTAVQSQVWPAALAGHNLLVVAKTGSGKTLAYLLPTMPHIMSQPLLERGQGPIVLVLCPTRELALQVEEEAGRFYPECRLRSCCVYGGAARQEQVARLAKGVELVVATPGRLLDLVDSGATNLSRVTFVVLDEADRMLSMGFGQFVSKIEALIRPDRQSLLLSATLPRDVEIIAQRYFRSPHVTIKIGASGGELAACTSVAQSIVVTTDAEKDALLLAELRGLPRYSQSLVFCKTRARVDEVAQSLQAVFGADRVRGIHGEHGQLQREAVLEGFKAKRIQTVVSTGLMGRGLDIPCITHVFSLDFPASVEEYVHRVGRTGRAGGTGTAVSYITHEHYSMAEELVAYLECCEQDVPEALVAMIPGGRKRAAEDSGSGAKRVRVSAPLSSYTAAAATSSVPVLKNATRRRGVALTEEGASSVAEAVPADSTSGSKTYYSTNPSQVLLLRNVVAPGKIEAELKEDMWHECDRLSNNSVLDVIVYEHKRWNLSGNLPDEEAVRLFVKFRTAAAALEVYKVMHGRQFDGRTIVAVFADPVHFERKQFAPVDGEPPMATTLLIRNMLNPEEMDDDFVPDVVAEMASFGHVASCKVFIADAPEYSHLQKEERVRVVVKFGSSQGAMQALVSVDGRQYSNREIAAHLYDDMRWALDDLAPNTSAEPALPLRCFLS